MARLDDLTILLTMVDKTGKAFKSVDKKLSKLQKSTALLSKAAKSLGPAFGAGFVAATARGSQLTEQLSAMARQTDQTLQESQALFNAVRSADPTTQVDRLNEAILTMKERFSDARDAGAGPLFGLIEDFDNFDIDLGVDDARLQLANFLEEVSQLDDANAKIFALKDILGDEDSRPFLNTINNTEKLNQLLIDLRTNIDQIPNIFSDADVERINRVKDANKQLVRDWDQFSVEAYALFAPLLELANKIASGLLSLGRGAVGGLTSVRDFFKDILGQGIADDPVQLTDSAIERLNARNAVTNRPSGVVYNEFGVFESMDAFDKHIADQRKQINDSLKKVVVLDQPFEVVSLKDKFLKDLFAAESERDGLQEAVNFRNDLRQQEIESIGTLATAFSTAGNAFADFSTTARAHSERAFKVFKGLQIAAATASAYSAAAQALADFSSLTTVDKIARAASVLSIGLGYVSQISRLTASGSGASGGSSRTAGTTTAQNTARGGTAQTETRSAGRTIIQLEGRDRTYDQTDIENLVDAFKQSGADIEVLYNS